MGGTAGTAQQISSQLIPSYLTDGYVDDMAPERPSRGWSTFVEQFEGGSLKRSRRHFKPFDTKADPRTAVGLG